MIFQIREPTTSDRIELRENDALNDNGHHVDEEARQERICRGAGEKSLARSPFFSMSKRVFSEASARDDSSPEESILDGEQYYDDDDDSDDETEAKETGLAQHEVSYELFPDLLQKIIDLGLLSSIST